MDVTEQRAAATAIASSQRVLRSFFVELQSALGSCSSSKAHADSLSSFSGPLRACLEEALEKVGSLEESIARITRIVDEAAELEVDPGNPDPGDQGQ